MFKATLETSANTTEVIAKYDLNQEVFIPGYQGYKKGYVVGIAPNYSSDGLVMFYYVSVPDKRTVTKIRRYPERLLFGSVRDVLSVLASEASAKEDELKLY